MRKLILILISVFLTGALMAQEKTTVSRKYDVAVSFGSMGEGTVRDTFLKEYYKKFIKTNKVIIPVIQASGCGREGEFKILFHLSKAKASIRNKFIAGLKSLIAKEEKKNRAMDEHSGGLQLEYNLTSEDLSFCRGGLGKW